MGVFWAESWPSCPEGWFRHLQTQNLALVTLAVQRSREAEIRTRRNLVRQNWRVLSESVTRAESVASVIRALCWLVLRLAADMGYTAIDTERSARSVELRVCTSAGLAPSGPRPHVTPD